MENNDNKKTLMQNDLIQESNHKPANSADTVKQRVSRTNRPHSTAWRITIQIVEANTELTVDVDESLVLGRSYSGQSESDMIDLAPYEAYHSGVSRRHAVLTVDDGHLMLMDDNSANGTYLAGKRLQPGRFYPIEEGDEVRLGGMRLSFRVV